MHRSGQMRLALAALSLGATGLAFAPIFVRWSEVGPSSTAFYRLLFALPWLWLWLWAKPGCDSIVQAPSVPRDYWILAGAGLFFLGDLCIWHWSLQFTNVANSTLFANCAPIFVTTGAWLFLGERIHARFVLGLALALAGAALLVRTSLDLSGDHLWGDLLAWVAALFYAGYQLLVKYLRRRFSTAAIMAGSGLVCCPGFLLVALLSGETLLPGHWAGWWVLVALALVSHLGGQTLIAYGFGHLPASFSSLVLLLQPVMAAVLAWLILAEPLSWLQILGGLITLAGIGLGRSFAMVRPG